MLAEPRQFMYSLYQPSVESRGAVKVRQLERRKQAKKIKEGMEGDKEGKCS